MEYFFILGILIIVIGDVKLVKYFDGFFMYVDWVFKMGWYVEVVLW